MAADVHALNRRYQSLRDERSPWDSAYADLALPFSPTKYRSDASNDNPRNLQILNSKLVDSTGVLDKLSFYVQIDLFRVIIFYISICYIKTVIQRSPEIAPCIPLFSGYYSGYPYKLAF